MKKSLRASALGLGMAGMVVAGAGAAHAAGTYVSVNGVNTVATVPFTAANSSSSIAFSTDFGTKMSCPTATATGNIYRGVEVKPNNVIGAITSFGMSGCTMGLFTLNVAMSGGDIEVTANPASAGAPVPVKIKNVNATITATTGGTCTFNATGSLDAVIASGSDATLTLNSATTTTGYTLDISNVVGCGGDVLNGDKAGAWKTNKTSTGVPSAFNVTTTGPLAGVVSHF